MYELTISIGLNDSKLIECITHELESYVKLIGGVLVSGLFDGRATMTLAVQDKDKNFIKSKVLCVVASEVVSYYKFKFLSENISEFNMLDSKKRSALIKALAEFDKDTDTNIVKKNLVFTNSILIDSLYHFKLGELKERWNEIAVLVSSSMPNLLAGDCLDDMLKFLIASSPSKIGEIYIVEKEDNMLLVSGKYESIFNKSMDNIEEDIISKLIGLSPEKIYIPGNIYEKYDFLKRVEDLFDGKVLITR